MSVDGDIWRSKKAITAAIALRVAKADEELDWSIDLEGLFRDANIVLAFEREEGDDYLFGFDPSEHDEDWKSRARASEHARGRIFEDVSLDSDDIRIYLNLR